MTLPKPNMSMLCSAGAVRWFATRFSAILAQLLAHLLVYIVLHSQVFFRVDVGVRVCDWYFFGGFFGVWIVCLSVCVCMCVCDWYFFGGFFGVWIVRVCDWYFF